MCMTCRRLQMLWCVTITLLWSYSLKHPQAKGGGWLKPTLIQDLNLLEACDARQTGWNPRNRWWIMEDHGSIKGFRSTYRPNFLRTPKCVGCIPKQLAWVGIHAWLILIHNNRQLHLEFVCFGAFLDPVWLSTGTEIHFYWMMFDPKNSMGHSCVRPSKYPLLNLSMPLNIKFRQRILRQSTICSLQGLMFLWPCHHSCFQVTQ